MNQQKDIEIDRALQQRQEKQIHRLHPCQMVVISLIVGSFVGLSSMDIKHKLLVRHTYLNGIVYQPHKKSIM
jgi:hypothetical protein